MRFQRLIIVMVVLAAVYAIVLQLTGQSAAAERFVEWAGGGIATIAIIGFLFA